MTHQEETAIQVDGPGIRTLEWIDVAPTIYKLHEFSFEPHTMQWPYMAWRGLGKSGLTNGTFAIDRFDSELRAVSLTLFHLEMLDRLRSVAAGDGFVERLEDMFTPNQINRVLAQKYHESSAGNHMDDVFAAINWHHLSQIVNALHRHFGSFMAALDSLIVSAADPGECPRCTLRVSDAHDCMWNTFDAFGDEIVKDELAELRELS